MSWAVKYFSYYYDIYIEQLKNTKSINIVSCIMHKAETPGFSLMKIYSLQINGGAEYIPQKNGPCIRNRQAGVQKGI